MNIKKKFFLVLGLLLMLTSVSNGSTFSGIYRIKAAHSGKCMDVSGVSQNHGAIIHQWGCHDGDNQRWQILPTEEDYYKIIAVHSGLCLDVYGGYQSDGASIIQWPCHTGWNQQFKLTYVGDGNYQIKVRHSGKVFDVEGNSLSNGADLVQWPTHSGENQKWKLVKEEYTHSKKVIINTSSTGAYIVGNVNNFPFLVRLNRLNFDFSEARENGEDLRFFSSDGRLLYQSIESWDAVRGEANVWVHVPKIWGNNSTQFIEMHWGNPDTKAWNNSKKVFTGKDGFVSVWHLENPNSDAVGSYNSQSINVNDENLEKGIIGNSVSFNGSDEYLEVPYRSALNPSIYTVSAWVKVKGGQGSFRSVITSRDDYNPRGYILYAAHTNIWEHWIGENGWPWKAAKGGEVKLDEWMLVTGTYKNGKLRLYVNGERISTSYVNYYHNNSRPLRIGAGSTEGSPRYFFNGLIDEARVSCVARSKYWIKLMYENQKINSKLVDIFIEEDINQWSHNKKIYMNTSPSGISISQNISNFPLLVRIDNTYLNFAEAQSSGEDLRFLDSDGNTLEYQIEHWDPTNQNGLVWVLIPQILGNSNNQYIEMIWGNSNALSRSNGKKVFQENHGFDGVWHLEDAGETEVKDITGRHTSFSVNMNSQNKVDGVIGKAVSLNGVDEYIDIPELLGNSPTVSLSGWANLNQRDSNGGEIISIGDIIGLRMDDIPRNGALGFYHPEQGDWKATVDSTLYSGTGWHYLSYVLDDNDHVQSLYVDGVLKSSSNNTEPLDYTGVGSSTLIGKHGNYKNNYDFNGVLDEIRVSNVSRNAEWIKLTYENQKIGSNFPSCKLSGPQITFVPTQIVTVADLLTFDVSAVDEEGNPIEVLTTVLPEFASYTNNTFSWIPYYLQVGEHRISFIATSNGVVNSMEVLIIVVPPGNKMLISTSTEGGSLDPEGTIVVETGTPVGFETKPEIGYVNDDILVNEVSTGGGQLVFVIADDHKRVHGVFREVNAKPSVKITQPSNGQVYFGSPDVTVAANGFDKEGELSMIKLLINGAEFETQSGSDFLTVLEKMNPGSYTLEAEAWDWGGRTALSDPVSIVVKPWMDPLITSPENNSTYTLGESIPVSATIEVGDQPISLMRFYDGVNKIAEFSEPPYDFTWTTAGPGDHFLYVVAAMGDTYTQTSSSVKVTVKPPEGDPVVVATVPGPLAEEPECMGCPTRNGKIVITRFNKIDLALTVNFSLEGDAKPGLDFVEIPLNVIFAAGENSKEIEIVPLMDNIREMGESINFSFTTSPDYNIGVPAEGRVFFRDFTHNAQKLLLTGVLQDYSNLGLDGNYNAVISLYEGENTQIILYEESFDATQNNPVKVKDGNFSVYLGEGYSVKTLTEIFNEHPDLYAEIRLEQYGYFETLYPRLRVNGFPYAMEVADTEENNSEEITGKNKLVLQGGLTIGFDSRVVNNVDIEVNLCTSLEGESCIYTEKFLTTDDQIEWNEDGFKIVLGDGEKEAGVPHVKDIISQFTNLFVEYAVHDGEFREVLNPRIPLTSVGNVINNGSADLVGSGPPGNFSFDIPIGSHYTDNVSNDIYLKTANNWKLIENPHLRMTVWEMTIAGNLTERETEDRSAIGYRGLNMTVRLYGSANEAGELYREDFFDNKRIYVQQGRFSITMGKEEKGGELRTIVQGNKDLYAEITVGKGREAEVMLPRIPLTSVPYGMNTVKILKGTGSPVDNSLQAQIGTLYIDEADGDKTWRMTKEGWE